MADCTEHGCVHDSGTSLTVFLEAFPEKKETKIDFKRQKKTLPKEDRRMGTFELRERGGDFLARKYRAMPERVGVEIGM